jgi:transposase
VHADNSGRHVSTKVKQSMKDHSLRTAPHPPYSPDLAPSDFFLFGYVKRALQRSKFQSADEVLKAVVRIFNQVPTDGLIATFHEWIKRLQEYIGNDEEYVESKLFWSQKLSLK